MRKFIVQGLPLWLLASFTLGLAPFSPEPHIWEKIRWIASGTFPMEGVYIFDLFLHGTPWLMLMLSLLLRIRPAGNA